MYTNMGNRFDYLAPTETLIVIPTTRASGGNGAIKELVAFLRKALEMKMVVLGMEAEEAVVFVNTPIVGFKGGVREELGIKRKGRGRPSGRVAEKKWDGSVLTPDLAIQHLAGGEDARLSGGPAAGKGRSTSTGAWYSLIVCVVLEVRFLWLLHMRCFTD